MKDPFITRMIALDLERCKPPKKLSAQELKDRLAAFEKNMQAKAKVGPQEKKPLTTTRALFDLLDAEGQLTFVKLGGTLRE